MHISGCLVGGLSRRRHEFNLSTLRIGFLVDEVTLKQVFLLVLCFSLPVIPLTPLMSAKTKPVIGLVHPSTLDMYGLGMKEMNLIQSRNGQKNTLENKHRHNS
jgi:hypothetical protein